MPSYPVLRGFGTGRVQLLSISTAEAVVVCVCVTWPPEDESLTLEVEPSAALSPATPKRPSQHSGRGRIPSVCSVRNADKSSCPLEGVAREEQHNAAQHAAVAPRTEFTAMGMFWIGWTFSSISVACCLTTTTT